MARTQEERDRLNKASRMYTGRDFGTAGYDEAFERSGVSADDRIRQILNSDEARSYAQQQAAAQYQPLLGDIDRTSAETKSDIDSLISELEKQKSEVPEQIFNDFNRRGLFRSSMAQKEVGSQVGQLVNKIGSAQVQRSTRLADLAAQRAQVLAKQTAYEIGFRDQNRQAFEDDVAARLKAEEELRRQLAAQRQQQDLMSLFAQQNTQPQPAQYYEDEDLPTLKPSYSQPAGPVNPNPAPTAWQQFSRPMSVSEQAKTVKNALGSAYNKVINTKTPQSLVGLRQLFGENLFRRG